MHLPSHLMFAIHSSIGFSLKGHHMGIGRISSVGVSGPVEGSGAAKPGPEAFLDLWLACHCVSSCVSLFSTES